MSYKYSVLMYNFNNYEIMREPQEIDPECEYVYVTDNPIYKYQTKVWKVIVDNDLKDMSPFDKCYNVRFNLFKYATAPVCIYVDGSIQIRKSLRKFYENFMKSKADIGLNIHPNRYNLPEEYAEWVRCRGYSSKQANKCLHAFKIMGYDFDFKGLYQGTCRICKNTELNMDIDNSTLKLLKMLGENGIIERLDQTVYTFIVNSVFNDIKIFPFSQQVFQSKYMYWCGHKSRAMMPWNPENNNNKYVMNELKPLYKLE